MLRALFALVLCSTIPAGAQAQPLMAAHRGLVAPGVPENSLAAIGAAVEAGLDIVEIDLRATADGAIILSHDATIDRVTGGRGRVAQSTLAQLRSFPLKEGPGRIATFEEALEAVRGTRSRLLLDLKRPGSIDPRHILALARSHGGISQIVVGARSAEDVRAYRRLDPDVTILAFMRTEEEWEAFAKAGANIIRLWARWIVQPAAGCLDGPLPTCIVQRLHAHGLKVWAIADAPAARAQRCFSWLAGVQIDGLLTNQPILARTASIAGTIGVPFSPRHQCGR